MGVLEEDDFLLDMVGGFVRPGRDGSGRACFVCLLLIADSALVSRVLGLARARSIEPQG